MGGIPTEGISIVIATIMRRNRAMAIGGVMVTPLLTLMTLWTAIVTVTMLDKDMVMGGDGEGGRTGSGTTMQTTPRVTPLPFPSLIVMLMLTLLLPADPMHHSDR